MQWMISFNVAKLKDEIILGEDVIPNKNLGQITLLQKIKMWPVRWKQSSGDLNKPPIILANARKMKADGLLR